jgi:RimJ/RimL family protein N-acetyltransferase
MFRGATQNEAEIAQILEIYAHARAQMAANGNPTQWGDSYPPRELLEEDIRSNRLFVYMLNGRMEAVFAFISGEDPTYAQIDGAWLNDEPYGTLHRVASAGTRHGVGAEIIAWCMERCDNLRADTHADNKTMQHVLESNGFTRCGIIHVADGSPRIAYQKVKPHAEGVQNDQ